MSKSKFFTNVRWLFWCGSTPKPPLCKGRWHGVSRDGGIVAIQSYHFAGTLCEFAAFPAQSLSQLTLTAPFTQGSLGAPAPVQPQYLCNFQICSFRNVNKRCAVSQHMLGKSDDDCAAIKMLRKAIMIMLMRKWNIKNEGTGLSMEQHPHCDI